eukprot:m.805497 g.805497  ORF g.805497 m.805497 type:complete len:488 (-) comp23373_c0_seq1:368-1831(-)
MFSTNSEVLEAVVISQMYSFEFNSKRHLLPNKHFQRARAIVSTKNKNNAEGQCFFLRCSATMSNTIVLTFTGPDGATVQHRLHGHGSDITSQQLFSSKPVSSTTSPRPAGRPLGELIQRIGPHLTTIIQMNVVSVPACPKCKRPYSDLNEDYCLSCGLFRSRIGMITEKELQRSYKKSSTLASGNFGHIYKYVKRIHTHYTLRMLCPSCTATRTYIAVKRPMKDKLQATIMFQNEIDIYELLAQYGGHVNVLKPMFLDLKMGFLGLEYMHKGSLQSIVRIAVKQRRMFPAEKLLQFSNDIAQGIAFLHNIRIVHRDMALRNILVDEHWVCRVSDFGTSVRVEPTTGVAVVSTQNNVIAPKWTPPESLSNTTASNGTISIKRSYDVWGLGVVIWEVFQHGIEPYGEMDSAREILSVLRSGYRLPCPEQCPTAVYMLMQQCWKADPLQRPDVTLIADGLRAMVPANVGAAAAESTPLLQGSSYTVQQTN